MSEGTAEFPTQTFDKPRRYEKTTTPRNKRNHHQTHKMTPRPYERTTTSTKTREKEFPSFTKAAAELSLVTAAPFLGLGGAAAVDHHITDVPLINTGHADIEPIKATAGTDEEKIKNGAHPQKYSNEGIKIVPIDQLPQKSVPNSEAELKVYRNYAKTRMEQLMNVKMSGKDYEHFSQQLAQMRKVVESNPSFEGMKAVVKNHENEIIASAAKYNVPAELLLSLALIENGGAEGLVSPAGAMGVLQVMPDLLNQKLEQRGMTLADFNKLGQADRDNLLIEFGASNLADMHNLFGDWGLATWAYHGGQGNVYRALKVYFGDKYDANNLPPGGFAELQKHYKEKISAASKQGFNFFVLLNDKKVLNEISDLGDETEFYTLKGMASGPIINEQMPDTVSKILNSNQVLARGSR